MRSPELFAVPGLLILTVTVYELLEHIQDTYIKHVSCLVYCFFQWLILYERIQTQYVVQDILVSINRTEPIIEESLYSQ